MSAWILEPMFIFQRKTFEAEKISTANVAGAAKANRILRNRKGFSSAIVSLARAYAIRERLWKFNLFITSCNFLFILSYHIRYSFIVYSFLRWRRLPYLWLCNIVIKFNEIKWEIKKLPGDWDLCKFAISRAATIWAHSGCAAYTLDTTDYTESVFLFINDFIYFYNFFFAGASNDAREWVKRF